MKLTTTRRPRSRRTPRASSRSRAARRSRSRRARRSRSRARRSRSSGQTVARQGHGAARMSDNLVGAGIAFPLRVDCARRPRALALERRRRRGDPPDRRHGPGRAADAARVRLRHPRLRLRVDRLLHARPDRLRDPRCARPLGAAHRPRRRRLRHLRGRARQARDRHHLLAARHQPRAQPRVSVLPHPGGVRSEHPADRARRPALPGPRQRGPDARRPGLPGVDRAQRLGPGHHADRAVRVDDRDARLPAQPHPRQAAALAAPAARDPGRRARGGHDRGALPASAPRGGGGRDPGRHDRGRHRAHGQRRVDRLPDELRLHDPAGAADGLPRRAGRRAQERGRRHGVARPKGADQLAFEQPPKVGNALYLGFDTSLARLLLRIDVDCSQARGAGVDPEDPPLRFEVSDEQAEGEWERGDRALRPDRRLQLRLRRDRAAAALAPLPEHHRGAAGVLGALPPRRASRARARRARASRMRPRSTQSPPGRSAP